MDLQKKDLPESLELEGRRYRIHTDFRYFLRMSKLLKNREAKISEFDFMYVDEKPLDRVAGFQELCHFMSPLHKLPRTTNDGQRHEPVIDYELDADLIYAAFMQQYKIDLFDIKELHWHKFMALLMGLRDTKLTDVIGYRLYEPNGDTSEYAKNQQKLHDAWAIENTEKDEALIEFEKFLGE